MPAAAAYYLLLTGTVRRWRRRRFIPLLTGTAAALAFSFSAPYLMPRADGTLSITFLDVGEGDAAVVQFPKGKVMVVDAGPAFRSGRDVGELVLAPYLRSRGIRRIDHLLVSHAQIDHAGGLRSLLREFRVDRLWDNGSDIARYFPRQWEDLPAPPRPEHLYAGKQPSPSYIDGVRLDILNPAAGYMEDHKRRPENARSLVIRLTYGDFSILFTGDIERDVQKTLISKSGALKATVIKVPHHGSKDAVHAPFIAAVNPEVAVISAGRYNHFGHPAPAALTAYSDRGTAIYRTDRDGAVSIVSDGRGYSVETFADSMRPHDIRKILMGR
jgi:competence protein ComEC